MLHIYIYIYIYIYDISRLRFNNIHFTLADEERSRFRNVVIIQCGVVFVTLWEKVLLFSRDVLQVAAALSRNSMV